MSTFTPRALAALRLSGINEYTMGAARDKYTLHTHGAQFLAQVAAALGIPLAGRDLRSNKGGMAVSGEVTLHTDTLYVQLYESCVGSSGVSVMYRTCKGRKDYCGGRNHITTGMAVALYPEQFVETLRKLMVQV
jgi:hypothetical protein